MYTVLRFISPTEDVEKLILIGERLNRFKENTFQGIDRIGGRFSSSVCEDDNWEEHTRAMSEFLRGFEQGLLEAKSYGIDLERSEEHTSELQSLAYLVCRLLLEKKKKYK